MKPVLLRFMVAEFCLAWPEEVRASSPGTVSHLPPAPTIESAAFDVEIVTQLKKDKPVCGG